MKKSLKNSTSLLISLKGFKEFSKLIPEYKDFVELLKVTIFYLQFKADYLLEHSNNTEFLIETENTKQNLHSENNATINLNK